MSRVTWSLRLRAVCSFSPTLPIFSVSRRSMFMWMSSSATLKGKSPLSISFWTARSPATILRASAAGMMRCRPSMRAWAMLPAMSCR